MATVRLVLVIVALVAFALAALGVAVPRLNLTAAGLFCWLLSNTV